MGTDLSRPSGNAKHEKRKEQKNAGGNI